MLRSILIAVVLTFATPNAFGQQPEPPRYWINSTTSPGEQVYGWIVDGYAVDITARRAKPVSTPLPIASKTRSDYVRFYVSEARVPSSSSPDGDSSPVVSEAAIFLSALNLWRAQHGRGPLRWDAGLAAYAASNGGVHAQGSSGGAMQCWAGTSSLTAALGLWQRSGAHAAILLNASSVIGAARCPSGSTANAR